MSKENSNTLQSNDAPRTRFCHVREKANPSGKAFTMAFRVENGVASYGYGFVSKHDQFNRRIGRSVASGRLRSYAVSTEVSPDASSDELITTGIALSSKALQEYSKKHSVE